MVEDQLVTQEGLGISVGICMGIFYANNGVLGLWYTEWLQGTLNVIIGLLSQCGMVVNVFKSKAMTCQPVTLRYGM